MPLLPEKTLNIIKTYNDLSIKLFGIECTLYIPNNLDSLETKDAYTAPQDIDYDIYYSQLVIIEWSAKNLFKLRKIGVYAEDEAPIRGYFKNVPEVIVGSYIKVPINYIPNNYDVDEFQVTNVVLDGTYNYEVLRSFKLAPRRVRE